MKQKKRKRSDKYCSQKLPGKRPRSFLKLPWEASQESSRFFFFVFSGPRTREELYVGTPPAPTPAVRTCFLGRAFRRSRSDGTRSVPQQPSAPRGSRFQPAPERGGWPPLLRPSQDSVESGVTGLRPTAPARWSAILGPLVCNISGQQKGFLRVF